jgi:ribosome-associated protein
MAAPRLPFPIPDSELEWSYSRSSGPGGQNVNKTATKATLRWDVTRSNALPPEVRERFLRAHATRLTRRGELVLHSQRERDQIRNSEDCLAKLAALLRAVARRPRPRRATQPTRGSKERRLKAKKRHGQTKRERRGALDD